MVILVVWSPAYTTSAMPRVVLRLCVIVGFVSLRSYIAASFNIWVVILEKLLLEVCICCSLLA